MVLPPQVPQASVTWSGRSRVARPTDWMASPVTARSWVVRLAAGSSRAVTEEPARPAEARWLALVHPTGASRAMAWEPVLRVPAPAGALAVLAGMGQHPLAAAASSSVVVAEAGAEPGD